MKSKISPEKHAEMLANLTAAYIASPQTDNRSALKMAKQTLAEIIGKTDQSGIDVLLQDKLFRAAKGAGKAVGWELISVAVRGDEIEYRWSDCRIPERKYAQIVDTRVVGSDGSLEVLIDGIFKACQRVMAEGEQP